MIVLEAIRKQEHRGLVPKRETIEGPSGPYQAIRWVRPADAFPDIEFGPKMGDVELAKFAEAASETLGKELNEYVKHVDAISSRVPASVGPGGHLMLGSSFFGKSTVAREFILMHELEHLGLDHPEETAKLKARGASRGEREEAQARHEVEVGDRVLSRVERSYPGLSPLNCPPEMPREAFREYRKHYFAREVFKKW